MVRVFLPTCALLIVPPARHIWSLQADGSGGELVAALATVCTAAGLIYWPRCMCVSHNSVLTERIAGRNLVGAPLRA